MNLYKKLAVFLVGGTAYVGVELLWRGRSHPSMFAAGGLCLLLIGALEDQENELPLPARMLLGSAIITMVELGTGLLVNQNYTVWDYRDMPGNFRGQICPQFCLLWLPLTAVAIGIYRKMQKWMER